MQIASTIARDNVAASLAFVDAARESIQLLQVHPRAGPVWSEARRGRPGIRKWGVNGFRNYLIFYTATDRDLIILRVLDGRRDLPSLLADMP